MTVLGLDAGRGGFSAALLREGTQLCALQLPGNQALEQGLAGVARVMEEARIAPQDLDRIGVGTGPGSFTGVRIAISYAKSLALAWRLPLAGVDTFDAIEAAIVLREPVFTVVRGRTGVISARYSDGGRHWRASGYVGDVLEQFALRAAQDEGGRTLALLGDAEDVLAGLAERGWNVQTTTPSVQPSALAVAMVAAKREPAASLHEIRADYGELPAVTISKPRLGAGGAQARRERLST